MAIFEHLRTSTVITRILYFGDFMNAWLSCRLVCREFLVAVNSIWIEVCRLFAEPALPLTPATAVCRDLDLAVCRDLDLAVCHL